MLEFKVEKQIIERTDTDRVVADSRSYLLAQFSLSEEWQNDVTVLFGHDGRFFQVLLEESGVCVVPFEVIKAPGFSVSLFCDGEKLVTANMLMVEVEPSGLEEGQVPGTPTPTLWQQYSEEMQKLVECGLPCIGDDGHWFLYNADVGEYEDTGILAKGVTPQKGTDYWTKEDIAEIKAYVDEAILGGAW